MTRASKVTSKGQTLQLPAAPVLALRLEGFVDSAIDAEVDAEVDAAPETALPRSPFQAYARISLARQRIAATEYPLGVIACASSKFLKLRRIDCR